MENPIAIYILHSEIPNNLGRNTGLKLCNIINNIVHGQPVCAQLINGIWSIWLKSVEVRNHLVELKMITPDNISIVLFSTYHLSKPVPNDKIILSELPFWVRDQEIIDLLSQHPGIIVKSGVIVSRHRDEHNRLTEYYSGDRFVFVDGKMPTALHSTARIDYNHCKIYHKLQENVCRRCRNVGHLASDLSKCPAYIEDNDGLTIRSPNCIYSNYYICKIRVFDIDFLSSEHAYQWRFAKYVGMNELANEIINGTITIRC